MVQQKAPKEDVAALVWDRKNNSTQKRKAQPKNLESKSWIKETSIHLPRRMNAKGGGLGLGLLALGQSLRGDLRLMAP
jgi:hypothetical protein